MASNATAATIRQPPWEKPVGSPVPQLHLFNSLTRKKELFVPVNGKRVTWYACGPTVYDKSHIGHARAFLSFDIVRRILEEYFGYDVQFVMNITDIDDKIIIGARQKYLFDNYKAANPAINSAVIAKAEEAWTLFVSKRLDKFYRASAAHPTLDAAANWSDFLARNAAGTLVGTADDLKFSMYLKTATTALDALSQAKAGKITAEDFYVSIKDVLSTLLDQKLGSTTTDQKIFRDFAAFWEQDFFKDMDSLNVRRPDVLTRISEYIPEVVSFVQRIIDNGFAYEHDGSVYFDTVRFDKSGKHSYAKIEPWSAGNVKLMKEGEGDLSGTSGGERNPADFALWKKSKPGEPAWPSPWGEGRPGWHIECSAMAGDVLGEKLDIHSGGIDLTFPHHDNELAQSESHYGCTQWVNYFLHNGHLHIDGMKMSKSLKNFISIKEALAQSSASLIRIVFLLHRWDTTLDYSAASMNEARVIETTFNNFMSLVSAVVNENKFGQGSAKHSTSHNYGKNEKELMEFLFSKQAAVHAALADSFDTPTALKELRQLVSQTNQYYQDTVKSKTTANSDLLTKVAKYVTKMLRIFGVYPDANPVIGSSSGSSSQNLEESLMPYLSTLSSFRDAVRELAQGKAEHKEFLKLCDRLRDEDLVELGVLLEDKDGGRALVKLVDRETILLQRQEKLAKEAERAREKEERLKALAQKKAERLEKGRLSHFDMFRTDEYSSWDEQGIPTKDKDGEDLSKSKRKKLEKEYAAQKKLHEEFLAETSLTETTE